jgi:D-serine deaminase-like pyridoxal phosphate-dependent protein
LKIQDQKPNSSGYPSFKDIANWYIINDADALDSPAMVVYPDRIKHNLALLKTHIDDAARLRPHVKTHKCSEVTLLTIAAGINKFKCATIAEAEMLGMCQAADVLLAYQPVGPKIGRLINLIKNYPLTRYSCLVDDAAVAGEISAAALKHALQINVFVDINAGMNRTGALPAAALQLYHQCSELQGIALIGLHVYDGHIHDTDMSTRQLKCNAAYQPVGLLLQQLQDEGYRPVVIAGGTPTFPIHARREGVECSPGTFIYWDDGYQRAFPEQQFLPAALLITRIISLPGETKLCVDLGHKAVASEDVLQKRVRFLNAPELVPLGHSEEHLVLEAPKGHRYKIGDILYGLPYHVCPTVALHESVATIENNYINGEWKTIARNRKINF